MGLFFLPSFTGGETTVIGSSSEGNSCLFEIAAGRFCLLLEDVTFTDWFSLLGGCSIGRFAILRSRELIDSSKRFLFFLEPSGDG